jgi:hypothetical protein
MGEALIAWGGRRLGCFGGRLALLGRRPSVVDERDVLLDEVPARLRGAFARLAEDQPEADVSLGMFDRLEDDESVHLPLARFGAVGFALIVAGVMNP